MADAWRKYKNFQNVSRTTNTAINDFIAEFEKEYLLAKSAGCDYSDTLLAFRLLEATNLSETDEKFVLTGVNYAEAKDAKNLVEQFKRSLKKFQGQTVVRGEEKIRYDPTLISSVQQVVQEVLAANANTWKGQPLKQRRRSNTDPGDNRRYKGKKNPLCRKDGKVLKCFTCDSEYHMNDVCPKNPANIKKSQPDDRNSRQEFGMCATAVEHDPPKEEKQHSTMHEFVMVAKTVRQLCLMVEEAGVKGVIDSFHCAKFKKNRRSQS